MSDRSLHASPSGSWKSIDELANGVTPSGEFADGASSAPIHENAVSRRGFMALVSASMALTAAACRRPDQKLVPAVKSLQNTTTPGLPMEYASVYSQGNVAYGALVRSREGRPVHVKGNPAHDSNRGAAAAHMIASLLSLYDPDRMRRPTIGGTQTSVDSAVSRIAKTFQDASAAGKKSVIVIDEHCSPSYDALLKEFVAAVPGTSVVVMPAVGHDNAATANQAVLGVDAEIVPDLSKAKVIVCVDADPLGTDKMAVHHTVRFTDSRRPSVASPVMSKLIVAEAQYSLTGANADERVRLHPSQLEAFLGALEGALGGSASGNADAATRTAADKVAKVLREAGSNGVVLVGGHMSPRAHAIGLAINNSLGSIGAGRIIDPSATLPYSAAKGNAVRMLEADMAAGNVQAMLFIDVNPEYSASRSFREAMARVNRKNRSSISMLVDETAQICDVNIPSSHWLESWGDAVAVNGTASVRQPLIAPLNEGIPVTEDILIQIGKKLVPTFLADVTDYYTYVKNRWGTDMALWAKVLQDGVMAAAVSTAGTTSTFAGVNAGGGASLQTAAVAQGRILLTVPSLGINDGRWANNGWLQEMPDPVTKISWDNVALISPAMAVSLGLAKSIDQKDLLKANEHVITVTTEHGGIDLPVWVQYGMADNVIVTQLGYGRIHGGTAGTGVGTNAYRVAAADAACGYHTIKDLKVVEGAKYRIATTQNHHTLDDGHGQRPVAKWLTLGDLKARNLETLDEEFNMQGKDGKYREPLSIISNYEYKGHRWGMVIDMSSCTGCSACVIACQSENNIPVVGKEQVIRGREMHWMRLDRYYIGDITNPQTVVEPMLCQHCENAPCENVCPVAATTHSAEGLNEMTYNRCVGTRYCLNNCPYKVRRFNFLNFNTDTRSPLDLAFNPDVTVRMRGVMEKCTFCVQRLHEAKWHARDEGRARIKDGEAVVACQEACPVGGIYFGDTNDKDSAVSKARQHERGFLVLAELNVRPQVTYLAKVFNSDTLTEKPHAQQHAAESHH